MRRLCLPQRPPLRPLWPLTLEEASVIVVSSTGKPKHPCDDAHAPSPFIDPPNAAHAAYGQIRYKFHNTAP